MKIGKPKNSSLISRILGLRKSENRRGFSRRGFVLGDFTAWLIVGVAIIVIGLAAYFIISGKASGLIDRIKNLFRLRRA